VFAVHDRDALAFPAGGGGVGDGVGEGVGVGVGEPVAVADDPPPHAARNRALMIAGPTSLRHFMIFFAFVIAFAS
jgi:hypothetical protein